LFRGAAASQEHLTCSYGFRALGLAAEPRTSRRSEDSSNVEVPCITDDIFADTKQPDNKSGKVTMTRPKQLARSTHRWRSVRGDAGATMQSRFRGEIARRAEHQGQPTIIKTWCPPKLLATAILGSLRYHGPRARQICQIVPGDAAGSMRACRLWMRRCVCASSLCLVD